MTAIEILSDLDVLIQPTLNLSMLSLDGVQFGSGVSNFPRHKITELTFAKIVHSYRWRIDIGGEYRDANNRLLTLDEVIDSVFQDDGVVHFKSKLSFKVSDGKIVGFAIYGAQLSHFSDIKTYDGCLQRFGVPDHVQKNVADGELMGYYNYYYRSRKQVSWDSWDNRVSLINLGLYDVIDTKPVMSLADEQGLP